MNKIILYVIASLVCLAAGQGLLAMAPTVGNCEPGMAIIKDVRGEILDDSAQIVIEANCDVDYLDYTLENPPRLIIDPVGKVYSDLKEVITFDTGPVKKVAVVKGRPEEGLTGGFYPLDFISIELAVEPTYKVKKDIKEEIIIEITEKKKAEVVAEPKVEEAKVEEPKAEESKTAKSEIVSQVETLVSETTEVTPLEAPIEETPLSLTTPARFIYKIGEGDNLDISVWQHPELDRKVVVRPDGFISFPLVGDIRAVELSPPQLAYNIKEALLRLIKDPQVTVIVSDFGSKNIFVLGEVAKPGVYPFRGNINILEAISASGGWRNSAVLNSVMLVRRVFTDQPEAHRLNVYAIIKNGDFSQNLTLEPGDVVYVPKSFVANIGGFIENLRISIGAYITESTKVFD